MNELMVHLLWFWAGGMLPTLAVALGTSKMFSEPMDWTDMVLVIGWPVLIWLVMIPEEDEDDDDEG